MKLKHMDECVPVCGRGYAEAPADLMGGARTQAPPIVLVSRGVGGASRSPSTPIQFSSAVRAA